MKWREFDDARRQCEVIATIQEDGPAVFTVGGVQISERAARAILEDPADWRKIHPKCGSFEEHCRETFLEIVCEALDPIGG